MELQCFKTAVHSERYWLYVPETDRYASYEQTAEDCERWKVTQKHSKCEQHHQKPETSFATASFIPVTLCGNWLVLSLSIWSGQNYFVLFHMPPKKGKSKKQDDAIESETPDSAEWKALKIQADRLHTLTKKEEHDFNAFQQQREKLNYFWIVEKKKLEDKRAELRNKHRELQDLEEKHQVEVKIYKQRLKHLLHEHQNDITVKKTEAEVALKMAQDDNREQQSDVKNERRSLNLALKEMELNHEQYVRGLKREQDQKITFLRHEFERKANEVQKLYEVRILQIRIPWH